MTARNRTIEFVDYVTRRYSAWDLGYDTYSALVVAVYEAESGQKPVLTPELEKEYNKYWERDFEPDLNVPMPRGRFTRVKGALKKRWPEKIE